MEEVGTAKKKTSARKESATKKPPPRPRSASLRLNGSFSSLMLRLSPWGRSSQVADLKEEEEDDDDEERLSLADEADASNEDGSEWEDDFVKEEEGYNILEDPEFADLETKSVFEDADDRQEKLYSSTNALENPRAETYDVLDISASYFVGDKYINRKLASRGLVPKAPVGGARWRQAKLVEERTPEKQDGVIWVFKFLDDITEEEKAVGLQGNAEISLPMPQMSRCVSPLGEKTNTSLSKEQWEELHGFTKGQKIDVLDVFKSKKGSGVVRRWRPATVKKVDGLWLRISFDGWKPIWDEWLHVYSDYGRIASFQKMTRKAERERSRRNKNFAKVLARKRDMMMVDMDADGNCLFRGVAHQVYGDPKKHRKVRNECCDHLLMYKERFSGVYDIVAHVRKMRRDRTWGDDLEIRAMEEVYDRPFEIYHVSRLGITYSPMKLHFQGDMPKKKVLEGVEPVRLSYHGNCHYNSIVSRSTPMYKNKVFKKTPKLRTTQYIKTHRERLFKESAKAEQARDDKRKKEELEKKKKEEQEGEEKVEEGDEEGEKEAGAAEEVNESAKEKKTEGTDLKDENESSDVADDLNKEENTPEEEQVEDEKPAENVSVDPAGAVADTRSPDVVEKAEKISSNKGVKDSKNDGMSESSTGRTSDASERLDEAKGEGALPVPVKSTESAEETVKKTV